MRITTPAIQEFDHRPHPAQALVGAFSVACAIPVGWLLMTHPFPDSDSILMSPTRAWWLGYVFLVTSPLSLTAAIALIRMTFFSKRRVAITDRSIIVPKPTWRDHSLDEIEIPFNEITRVTLDDDPIFGRDLWIIHTGGRVVLRAQMFRSRREFDAMARAVMKTTGYGDDAPDEVE
ncbi:MAG: hypothetical protein ACYC61_23720 [Isosphaeraceae bacterium]